MFTNNRHSAISRYRIESNDSHVSSWYFQRYLSVWRFVLWHTFKRKIMICHDIYWSSISNSITFKQFSYDVLFLFNLRTCELIASIIIKNTIFTLATLLYWRNDIKLTGVIIKQLLKLILEWFKKNSIDI